MDHPDSVAGLSIINSVANVIRSVMNPTCASNVVSLLCHSFFQECRQVKDSSENDVWVPSLLCRGECERHWRIWSDCIDILEADGEAKAIFDARMLELVRGCGHTWHFPSMIVFCFIFNARLE